MTTLSGKVAAAIVVLAWFFLPSIGHAAACTKSLGSLQGWYGMLISGTNAADSTNKYFTGAVFFDGAGNLSGSNIYSGTGTDSAASGTYALNSDCSLSLTMTIGSGAAQEFTVGVRSSTNEAVGVEVDSSAVATIDLQAQYSTYTPGLNFTSTSANGSFAANCINTLTNTSDLNLATFANGTITGTSAFNNAGSFATANTSYTGTYRVNSDGTIVGSVLYRGTSLGVYGVLSNANSEIQYIYTTTSGSVTSPYAACSGALVPATTPSFSIEASAATLGVVQGANGNDAISVTASNGFNGQVSFSASGLPAGATAAFSPVTSASGTSLTITAASSTPTGSYLITITGTSGTLTATTGVTLTVTANTAPGFTLTPSSATLTLQQNSGGTDFITVTPVNGFTGPVNLAVSGLPSGAQSAFSGTELIVFPAINTPVGSYKLTITGTSGSTTASTTVNLVITAGASFKLTPSAGSVSVAPGQSVSDAISITPSNGFNLSISFSVSGLPAGVTAAFNPASSTSGTTLALTTAATTTTGSYPIVISGTSSGSGTSNPLTQTTTVTLVVASAAAPGFTLSPATGTLTLAQNVKGSDNITVTPVNGFTGTVSLSVSGLPSGATGTFTGTTLVVFPGLSTPVGTYPLTITGTSGSTKASNSVKLVITAGASFTLAPSTGSVSVAPGKSVSDAISVVGSNGFNAPVSFTASGLPAGVTAAFSPASSSTGTTLALTSAATTVAGSYPILITGTTVGSATSNAIKQTTTVTLVVAAASAPGFTLSATTSTLTLAQNVKGTDKITVTPVNGFTGSVSLSVSGLPSGATGTFTGTTLAIFPGLSTPVGTYPLTIKGTSGSTTAATTVNLVITAGASFTLAPGAGSVSVAPGKSVSDALIVVGSNGFNAPVSFSATGLPAGVTAAFSPTSSSSGTILALTSAATTVAGSYPIVVTGTTSATATSNAIKQTTTVTLVVASAAAPGFTLSPATGTLTLAQNVKGSDTITVTPVNGFTGTVSLSVSGLPSGAAGSFTGTTLVIFPGSSTPVGTYPLTITGTSGSTKASTTVKLVITAGASFKLSPSAGSVSVAAGKSVSDVITVTGSNGFNAAVSFTASGLPAGVTAAFSPASSASATTLALTSASTTAAGSYPIVITGTTSATATSNGLKQTATVTLVVATSSAPGSFTLAAATGTLRLAQNVKGSDTITVTPVNGFTGSVSLTVSGLPSGATGSFTGTTLEILPAISTPVGSYKLTIKGTSGSTTASTSVDLVITAGASFTLSPGADSVSVSTGTSVSDAISVIGANGFDAAVSFSASGLPAGVTAAFSPASSSTGTILALKSAATTVPGSYSIVITGASSATATSNALQQTTTITLVVASSSASGFTLTPASGTLKVALNQSGSEGIVVKAVNGFSGVVVLNVSGLPSGATSGFLCDTLLVSVPAGTATGTYPLTITGISGTKTATTTVSLVVEP